MYQNTNTTPSPLTYLKQQLSFTVKEWNELTDEDKAQLKAWAAEEIAAA